MSHRINVCRLVEVVTWGEEAWGGSSTDVSRQLQVACRSMLSAWQFGSCVFH